MSTRRSIGSVLLALLPLVSGALHPSPGWSQALGANVAGQAMGGDLIRQPGQTGTMNIPTQNGNTYVYPWPAGTQNPGVQPVIDAIGFFKRPDPYTNGIPLGWNGWGGVIQDCKSQIEQLPGNGSFFRIRVYDFKHDLVVSADSPSPLPTWCNWDPTKGFPHLIWDQAAHPVGNPNPPLWAPGPPAQQAVDGGKEKGGDPVELATGLFIMEQVDLMIPDLMPLTLTRTYRQNDPGSRPFGIGSSHPYDIWLIRDDYCSIMQLILPDGARETYTRTSGTDCFSASLVNQNSPTASLGATLNWDNSRQLWSLKRKDGTTYRFSSMLTYAQLLLMELEDRNGNLTSMIRDSLGRLTRIISPSSKFFQFTYDTSNRVAQISDNSGRQVTYTYDASARLWKVTNPNSGVTEYSYDASHRMLTIKDPKNITYLTNTYDANGRVATQTQADSTTYQFAYTLDGSGKVTQTEVTDPRGFVRRVTFNSSGYVLTDTAAFGESEAQPTTYTRQTGTNLILSVTDALNRQTTYTYDTKGNILTVTRLATTPNAVTTTFTYDPTWNQLTSVTDPLNHTTSFGYDTKGNLTSITNALTEVFNITVNAQGLPLTIQDPLTNTTTLSYSMGDLSSVRLKQAP